MFHDSLTRARKRAARRVKLRNRKAFRRVVTERKRAAGEDKITVKTVAVSLSRAYKLFLVYFRFFLVSFKHSWNCFEFPKIKMNFWRWVKLILWMAWSPETIGVEFGKRWFMNIYSRDLTLIRFFLMVYIGILFMIYIVCFWWWIVGRIVFRWRMFGTPFRSELDEDERFFDDWFNPF